ncbi:MAG: YihY/virulence factor BrkB family protein [Vulcanimicrobiaceae bacterium]
MIAVIRRTATEWSEHNGWIFAAAMAAFAGLALAPIVLIAVRVAGTFGHERSMLAVLGKALGLVIGAQQAHSVDATVRASNTGDHGAFPIILAAIIAISAGSRFVNALQKALQTMWGTTQTGNRPNLLVTVRDILISGTAATLALTGLLGLLVAGSMLFAAASNASPGIFGAPLVRVGIAIGAAVALVPLFAALFKWLSHTPVAWSDVWVGATATALLFAGGQVVIGAYLALRHVQSMYGSASAIVVLLLWLYYSAYTFLVGAEFAQVYSRSCGSLASKQA